MHLDVPGSRVCPTVHCLIAYGAAICSDAVGKSASGANTYRNPIDIAVIHGAAVLGTGFSTVVNRFDRSIAHHISLQVRSGFLGLKTGGVSSP